jgi:hypothetical protein
LVVRSFESTLLTVSRKAIDSSTLTRGWYEGEARFVISFEVGDSSSVELFEQIVPSISKDVQRNNHGLIGIVSLLYLDIASLYIEQQNQKQMCTRIDRWCLMKYCTCCKNNECMQVSPLLTMIMVHSNRNEMNRKISIFAGTGPTHLLLYHRDSFV